MAVEFKDYYEVLGVPRDATQADIQRSFRKLARKYHPDVNKEPGAEERFKEINEAYEVLKDPEKRQKYDQLGANWKHGQDFRPPPGWDVHADFGREAAGGERTFFWSSGGGGFSDFFESIFGGQPFQRGYQGPQDRYGYTRQQPGADYESTLQISLEDAYHGGTKEVSLRSQNTGSAAAQEKRYTVKIPPGILPGQKIRLAGQGGEGSEGGRKGDIYLKVAIAPHSRFRLQGRDLYTDVAITPWEAALGAEIDVSTLGGLLTLKIPPGTQSGRKMRLRGKGMPNPKGAAGDLYAVIQIEVPPSLSAKEQEHFQELSKISTFNPRA